MSETRGRKPIVYTESQKERMEKSGKRIEHLIKNSSISQRKIAQALCVDPAMIRRYQNGSQMIPDDLAKKLAGILGVIPEYILCESNFPDPDIETYNEEQDTLSAARAEKRLDFQQIIDAGSERFFNDLGIDYGHIWPQNMNVDYSDCSDDIDAYVGTHYLRNRATGYKLTFSSESFKKLKEALLEGHRQP